MGTTTEAIINKSEDTINTNKHKTTDAFLETHETEETMIAEITANNISTTHISNKENECNTTETTTNEVTAENIKILPKASPPPQVIIIPTTTTTTKTATNESSTVATNAAKKIRRAFSMPRNPFRWSHKLKTSTLNSTQTNTEETKTGQDSGGGGVKGGGGSGGITALTSITKSYTLSSCVGGKRERADSFVSLNEDNYVPTNTKTKTNTTTTNIAPTLNSNDTDTDSKDTQQNQSCITSNASEKEETNVKSTINNSSITKSSNKKFSTKSNTINGVSNLTNSSTLPSGASLFSTLPAGASNSNHHNHHNNNNNRIFRRSSFRKFLNRITQHMTTTSSNKPHSATTANGHTISSTTDRVPPISGYQWPNDQTPGVMGLKNHGNTCFMNAVLQCLSHTDILAEYFVLDQYKADLKRRNKINSRKFGTKGELTEQLANVLKALWTCKNESDHSTSFKAVVDRYGSQFRSSTQHDAQEFLFWLLDKVHEDLNTATKRRYKSVKNNYGRPDEVIAAETLANHIRCNNSFVQAVFQAQFRSSLTCPRCKKQSNTFDPFHCISVQLPQLTQQTIFVTVVYLTQQPRQVRMGLTVTAGSPIMALREQLHKDTGIPNERMVLVDLQKEGFMRVFYDTQPVNTLQGIETIYCIEVPNEKEATKADAATSAAAASTSTSQANMNANPQSADLLVLVANVKKKKLTSAGDNNDKKEKFSLERFGAPFCLQVPRDCSYSELQKKLLKEMSALLKPEVFSYSTPLNEMFQIRLQDPSADPDTFIEQVEHPLLTEMIDLALSVLSAEAGPTHVKLLLEWQEPETHFCDLSDQVVEHESVPRLLASKSNDTAALTLEQCLEHYTKAETLSAEDAWRCPHCQEYLPVVKTLGLWSLPDILVVHFKRFRQHHGKGANAAKLTTMVNFPLHSFDMSPHLARGVNDINNSSNTLTAESGSAFNRPSPWRKSKSGDSRSSTLSSRDNRETRYDLYAVCYHQGDTLETGHYTAACKNPYDRQWYKFDDQRVSKVSSDSLPEEIVNNEAYMLFYQRRNSENPECSGSSSNSSDHWVSRIAPPPLQPAQAPAAAAVPVAASSAPKTNNSEDSEKMEAITAKAVTTEDIEMEEKSKDSKELDITKPIKELETKEENAQTTNENQLSIAATTTAQTSKTENNLDALEKLLDYADADVINEETDDLEQQLEKLEIKENDDEQTTEIFTMDEDCKLEAEEQLETKAIITNNEAPKANSQQPQTALTNGFDKEPQEQDVVDNNIKKEKTTPTTSSNSSTSSLASQSPAPSSLAISKDAANNLQNKFNGFKPTTTTQANSANNEKEHLLSSSLKSNSSSIIGSALAGHFSTYRQPWHGSRSSVSAVENTTQNANSVVGQHSTLHLRHSFSTASNYRLRECGDTLSSVLRNSVNTCSKDTLIFLDQQQHHHHHHNHHRHHHHHSLMEDDDDSTFMGSRSLWISPVTPHKLITVSPKN